MAVLSSTYSYTSNFSLVEVEHNLLCHKNIHEVWFNNLLKVF